MMYIKARRISLVTSVLLLSLLGFGGCGSQSSSSSSSKATPATSSTTYKGRSIDGYLKGATVELDGHTTKTDANGSWSISIPGKIPKNSIVTTTGGIDTSTGQPFEGKLSAIVNTNNTPTVVTSLTSLVVPLVQKGFTKSEALTTVATQLNVPMSAITSNPISNLSSTNPNVVTGAQKAIKQSLIVQKVAEAFAKSVVADANNTNFDKVTNAVFKYIANQLNNNNGLKSIVANTDGIATGVAKTIEHDDKSINIKNVSEKLNASASAIKSVADTLIAVPPENITKNSFDKTSKGIEIITAATEKKLTIISKANTLTGIKTGGINADNIAKKFYKLGAPTIIANVTKNTNISKVINKTVNITNITNITNIIHTSTISPTTPTKVNVQSNTPNVNLSKNKNSILTPPMPPQIPTLQTIPLPKE